MLADPLASHHAQPAVAAADGPSHLPPDLLNPVTGDQLWFEKLPAPESPELIFRCRIPAGSPGTPLHFHRSTDEHFTAVAGELSMIVGPGKSSAERRLAPGQSISVPRGTPHRFWNPSSAPVTFRSHVTPGAEFRQFLLTVYGLGADRLVGADGMPRNPLAIAVIRELSDLYFPGIPLLIQRPAFGLLSWLATASGTRSRLSRYWTAPAPAQEVAK